MFLAMRRVPENHGCIQVYSLATRISSTPKCQSERLWEFGGSLRHLFIPGVGSRVIRYIFQLLANFFAPLIDQLNGSLTIGGVGEDIELDEIDQFRVCWTTLWNSVASFPCTNPSRIQFGVDSPAAVQNCANKSRWRKPIFHS